MGEPHQVAPYPKHDKLDRAGPLQAAFRHPLMSFQNPGAEKYQEGVRRELIIFSGLKN